MAVDYSQMPSGLVAKVMVGFKIRFTYIRINLRVFFLLSFAFRMVSFRGCKEFVFSPAHSEAV